jgi:polyisoprenyl-phosphate glycosyltransferase
MTFLSIVIPLYRCSAFIPDLTNRLKECLPQITDDYEIIFINDGSPENDWEEVKIHSLKDNRIKGIDFSRNFGQHYAITAGLKYAGGNWVVVMDGDLQDQPEVIPRLYKEALNKYDVVFAKRIFRRDKLFRRFASQLFYSIYNYFTDSHFSSRVANFSISNRRVIDNFLKIKEIDRSFPLIIHWLGFKIGYIDIEHKSRKTGNSSYNIIKLIEFAGASIISQSNKPLRVSVFSGLLISFISAIMGIVIIIKKLFFGIPVAGWASLIVSIFFFGGFILANLGIIGIYIGRTFSETKKRPLYIINEKIGF